MIDYKLKYLKYKLKYEKLLIGGMEATPEDVGRYVNILNGDQTGLARITGSTHDGKQWETTLGRINLEEKNTHWEWTSAPQRGLNITTQEFKPSNVTAPQRGFNINAQAFKPSHLGTIWQGSAPEDPIQDQNDMPNTTPAAHFDTTGQGSTPPGSDGSFSMQLRSQSRAPINARPVASNPDPAAPHPPPAPVPSIFSINSQAFTNTVQPVNSSNVLGVTGNDTTSEQDIQQRMLERHYMLTMYNNHTITEAQFILPQIPKHMIDVKDLRIDLTSLDVYTIDPPGSTDADDAFSLVLDNDNVFLYIHIADPTEENITENLSSELMKNCAEQVVTRYPTYGSTIHMLPPEIVDMYTLQARTGDTEKKPAITFIYKVDDNYDTHFQEFRFSTITVKKELTLTYKQAGNLYSIHEKLKNKQNNMKDILLNAAVLETKEKTSLVLNLCSFIAEKFRDKRGGRDPMTFIQFKNGIVTAEIDIHERQMKSLIEEFALMTGTETARLIKDYNFPTLYRASRAGSAYMSIEEAQHDDLGFNVYSWVTSPMRRFSDIYLHYVLRMISIVQKKKNLNIKKMYDEFNKIYTINLREDIKDNINRVTQSINNQSRNGLKYKFLEFLYLHKNIDIILNLQCRLTRNNDALVLFCERITINGNLHRPTRTHNIERISLFYRIGKRYSSDKIKELIEKIKLANPNQDHPFKEIIIKAPNNKLKRFQIGTVMNNDDDYIEEEWFKEIISKLLNE